MEQRLKQQARADFHDMIHHHSRSLQGLLATTADAVRETVTVQARQSENKTLTLFDQVYRSMAVLSRPSIRALYQAMVDYVSPANTPDNLQQSLTRETLQERFIDFFTRLFPIAYHHAINPDRQDFTEKFKSCLYETMNDIQPFGDIPQEISKSVSKSLEATRVLIQALTLGKTVLDKTDNVLFVGSSGPQQEACYEALLRMTYCPRCKGIGSTVRPCSGFCTNVMRGCLTVPASELDLAWSGYVETVERLVVAVDGHTDPLGLNVEKAVRQLDVRISDAIMHAMENGPVLEEKVRKVCGRSELLPLNEEHAASSDAAAKSTSSSHGNRAVHAAAMSLPAHGHRTLPEKLHVQLGNFLASVVRSRIFYGTLADTICEEYPDKRCWNGERVGEYTKTVVDSSLTAQRYNPEFTITTMPSTPATYASNTNTSALIDQLRHINQVVQSQLASSPDAGVFLGDEALEGSGSGDSAVWRPRATEIDDDEDGHGGDGDDDDEASGSGMGPTTTGTMSCRPHTSALILRSDNPHNSTRYVTETKLYCRLLSTVSAIKSSGENPSERSIPRRIVDDPTVIRCLYFYLRIACRLNCVVVGTRGRSRSQNHGQRRQRR
ncbi:hypothetical protein DMN91_007303 [Ooceraea biroi]|uniref:Division abnormally delayed protein n=1 Tax=Ooceraea biroi TaxID=2015173 RepID=A0A3L8DJU7_OOCBI|nr:hypothetical protein DMN91_007303 [Ooceraea biroi]